MSSSQVRILSADVRGNGERGSREWGGAPSGVWIILQHSLELVKRAEIEVSFVLSCPRWTLKTFNHPLQCRVPLGRIWGLLPCPALTL